MVVDDNHAAAHGLAELLRYRGHTVTEINDAMSVIQTIQRTHPNVVILDIGLPIMNGYEVAEHIRQDVRHDLVLVALTGYGQDEDKRKAKQAGFDYHLTKPIGLADIEKILAEI